MINVDQGRSLMVPRIDSQSRFEFYQRTVDLKKLYKAMVTGDNIEDYMTRFKCREDEEQFVIRKYITQECVSPAINEAVSQFVKTSRYPNITKELRYKNDDQKRLEILKEQLAKFCYDGDIQEYLASEYEMRAILDPNGFLIVDFNDFDAVQNERPGVYGVYIGAEDVVDFEIFPNDELNYLIITKREEFFNKDSVKVSVLDYLGYLGNEILIYQRVEDDRIIPSKPGGEFVDIGGNMFYTYVLQPKSKQVQAMRLGYSKDPITNFRTVVSPIGKAETTAIDLINDKSNYDQTKLLHCFPQKFAFERKCPGEGGISTCNNGVSTNGSTCQRCNGTGIVVHTSASDVITLPMPNDTDEYVVKLSEMVHYAKPDIDIIQHLREDMENGKLAIQRAIFTTESVAKADGNVKIENTATEFVAKSDDKNNILLPACIHKSKFYKFIIRQIAIFNDLEEGLIVLFEYPKSLSLESIEQLQEKYNKMVESGASATLLNDIEKEIAAKRFQDDPEGLKKFNTWSAHRPFKGRTTAEIEFAIGNGSIPKWIEVLWANFETIMVEIENENSNFYMIDYKKQRELIKSMAEEYAAALPSEQEPKSFVNTSKEE